MLCRSEWPTRRALCPTCPLSNSTRVPAAWKYRSLAHSTQMANRSSRSRPDVLPGMNMRIFSFVDGKWLAGTVKKVKLVDFDGSLEEPYVEWDDKGRRPQSQWVTTWVWELDGTPGSRPQPPSPSSQPQIPIPQVPPEQSAECSRTPSCSGSHAARSGVSCGAPQPARLLPLQPRKRQPVALDLDSPFPVVVDPKRLRGSGAGDDGGASSWNKEVAPETTAELGLAVEAAASETETETEMGEDGEQQGSSEAGSSRDGHGSRMLVVRPSSGGCVVSGCKEAACHPHPLITGMRVCTAHRERLIALPERSSLGECPVKHDWGACFSRGCQRNFERPCCLCGEEGALRSCCGQAGCTAQLHTSCRELMMRRVRGSDGKWGTLAGEEQEASEEVPESSYKGRWLRVW